MGDSVTADIAAANAAGVESILFTEGKEPPEGHGATYVARTYREALDILLANGRITAFWPLEPGGILDADFAGGG